MIKIEHKEEYVDGEKVKDCYNIDEDGVYRRFGQYINGLSLEEIKNLSNQLLEVIKKAENK